MKLNLLGGTALLAVLAMGGAAEAADVSAPSYDWSGFYAGFAAGAVFDNSNVDTNVTGGGDVLANGRAWDEKNSTGVTGGGMLGYNWQIDRLVLGLETDMNYGDLKGSGGSIFEEDLTGAVYDLQWYGTLRGRAGYAIDNVLFYGTAGLAYGGLDTSYAVDWLIYDQKQTVNVGWTAGAGAEYGIGKWSLGAEYLYVDLGKQDASISGDIDGVDFKIRNAVDYRFSVARATVKYRF